MLAETRGKKPGVLLVAARQVFLVGVKNPLDAA
jgi:hypothetical protein